MTINMRVIASLIITLVSVHASSHEVDKSKISNPVVTVSNFNAIPPFIKGTKLIATQMDLMQLKTLQTLDVAPLPFQSDPVAIFMVWHERSNNDPAHRWLRQKVEAIAQKIKSEIADG